MMRELGVGWRGLGTHRGRLAGLDGLLEVQHKIRRIRRSSPAWCAIMSGLYLILVCSIRSR